MDMGLHFRVFLASASLSEYPLSQTDRPCTSIWQPVRALEAASNREIFHLE